MRILLTPLLGAALLSGCVLSPGGSASLSDPFVLAERSAKDGARTRFRVAPDREDPAIVRIDTRTHEVAHLGVTVRDIDREFARELGVEPWRGVRLTGVRGNSAARAAGLTAGDVVLSLAGEEITNVEQFQEIVAEVLSPGVEVLGRRSRRSGGGEQVEEEFRVTPGSRTVDESTTERFSVEAPPMLLARTGMQVATVEANLARDVGLGDESVALITGVVAGASAYDEGLRGGDLILECGGRPVGSAADVMRALDEDGARLEVLVDGPLGRHRAVVRTDEDVDARRQFYVPIVLKHSTRVDRTRTSFLDFIFQFGFNYRRTVYGSETREPYEATYLSLFPLGMFEFERSPTKSRNTIFWLITWSTRR